MGRCGALSAMPGGVAEVMVIFRKAAPTDAQLKAGNYSKRKVAWNGLTISIENERGSVRRGTDRTGKTWSTQMRHAYGYIKGSLGVDKDQVDCYLGPKLETAPMVYVVHQRQVGDWERYDEDKCMLGFPDEAAAQRAFLAHYDDPRFLGPITAMPVAEFVAKVKATADRPSMLKARLVVLLKARRYRDQPGYRLQDKRWHATQNDSQLAPVQAKATETSMKVPSSAGLTSQEEAKAYWLEHFGGKTVPLTVNSGGKAFAIKVRFPLENDHAYTSDYGTPGQRMGFRSFDRDRAAAMERIPQVIEFPQRRLRDGDATLLLEKRLGNRHYTIVLTWESKANYRFSTAHFKTIPEVAQLFQRQTLPQKKGPL